MEQTKNHNFNNEINKTKGNGNKKIIYILIIALLCFAGISFFYFNVYKKNNDSAGKKNEFDDLLQLNTIVKDTDSDFEQSCEDIYKDNFLLNLSFGEYEDICPDLLPDICRKKDLQYYNREESAENDPLGICNNICFIVNYASRDDNYYEEVVEGWKYTEKYKEQATVYKNIPDVPGKRYGADFYPWRVGLAYRLNKVDRVNNICDFFYDEEREKCKNRASSTLNMLNDFSNKCDF